MIKGGFQRVAWRVVAAVLNWLARGVSWAAGKLLDLMTWLLALAQSARLLGEPPPGRSALDQRNGSGKR